MQWNKIRNLYPHQWLLIEAIKAHTESGKRILDQLSVINTFTKSQEAMKDYSQLHHKMPERELYILHTDKETIDISERKWLGIRGANEI